MKPYALEFLMLMKSRFRAVLLGIFISALSSLSSISLMAVSGWFLTSMAVAGVSGAVVNLFLASALIRFFALSRTLLRYAERLITHDATFKVIEALRLSLFQKALQLPYLQYVKLQESNTLRIFEESTQKLELGYIRQFLPVCCAILCGMAAGGFFFGISSSIGFTVLILALLSGVIAPLALSKFTYLKIRLANQNGSILHNQASDLIFGIYDLKLTRTLAAKSLKFMQLSSKNADIKFALELIFEIGTALVSLCSGLTLILAMGLGAKSMSDGLLQGPEVIMLSLCAAVFFEIIVPLNAAVLNLGGFSLAANDVFGFMEKAQGSRKTAAFTLPKLESIAFEGVSFAYDSQQLSLIRNLSFKLNANENYLISGRSGCGKSTLLSLATGLINPDAGKISFNGLDLKTLDQRSALAHVSCCLQQNLLFSGSILSLFEGIKPDIKTDEILNILKIVELDDFILSLPNGIRQWIGDTGTGLSGGQQRRLCLALSLVRDKEFLFLDEPSTGLDLSQAQRITARILARRTGVVLISHLRSHAKLCRNKIAFHDKGVSINF